MRLRLIGLAVGLTVACESRSAQDTDAGRDSAPAGDAAGDVANPRPDVTNPVPDGDPPILADSRVKDQSVKDQTITTADAGTKPCPPVGVWARGACVPTTEMGCSAGCDPADPGTCPPDRKCDPLAASPCEACAAIVPACVPLMAMGFPPGQLRISPTEGIAGELVTIRIDGGEFYIGALFWTVGVGGVPAVVVNQPTHCTLKATFTPPAPGIYAVEVTYGTTSLAGFFTASGGVVGPPTVQPGFPCGPTDTCAQDATYQCACVQGRCSCN